jgi:tetratricopeptide (TPR) repeat protein
LASFIQGAIMTSHKNALLVFTALTCLGLGQVLADGMGGGGSLGSNQMPSVSAPRYDAAKEYQKGADALKAKDFQTADTAFNHALEVAPNNVNVLNLSGITKLSLNDAKGANGAFKKALAADPKNILSRRYYALTLVVLGDKDGAAKELDTLKQRIAACADTCAEAADLKAAIASVDAAVNVPGKQSSIGQPGLLLGDAKSGDSAYVTAVAQINEHHYGDALKSLKKAGEVFGPHPDVLTYIGYTYRHLGQYDAAENYYRQALAIAPNHRGATEYYGELKVERGDIAGARMMLAKLDNLCSFGCVEAEDLRRWIAKGHE